jgi:transcription termination factor Rho
LAPETVEKETLEGKQVAELQTIAETLGVSVKRGMRKAELIDAIVRSNGGSTGNGDAGAAQTAAEAAAGDEPANRTGDDDEPANRTGDDDEPAGRTRDDDTSAGETFPDESGGPGNEADAPAPSNGQVANSDSSSEGSVATQERTERQGGGDRQGGDRGQNRGGDRDRGDRQGGGQNRDQNRDGGQGGQNRDGGQRQGDQRQGGQNDPRRRPSREERRRNREERRQREVEEREQELAEAPVRVGLLDVLPEGYGFLRTSGYLPGPDDVYVSLSQIRRFALRKGDTIEGAIRRPKDNEKYYALLRIDSVNGMDAEEAKARPVFDKLTPLFPDERIRLEHSPTQVSERIIDLIAPIGKGQRGMVVSPPKAGKTTVLKQIANGFIDSDPELHMIILLVDERPEEVTDWQRTVAAAEVVYSTFDKPPDQHIQVTELVLERAKRLAEMGKDVAIVLDSITRLARAYNLAAPASGKILSGGIDSTALYPPRRFFGAARNIEEGGSVTIIASALVETGSRMDEGIFEEFKGTGNWEIRLDRQLSEKRIFPAINVEASGTRKEELLMSTEELALVWRLRRVLHALDSAPSLELLVDKVRSTKSNEQFLREIAKAPSG